MVEGYIYSSSTNCVAYILSKNFNEFTLDNFIDDNGKILYRLDASNEKNKYYYNLYKEAFNNGQELYVDLVRFTKAFKFLKNKTKEYKNSLTNGQKCANSIREMQEIFSKSRD